MTGQELWKRAYENPFSKARVGEGVYEWYNDKFVSDDLGLEIDRRVRFLDLIDCLYFEPDNLYRALGVEDSLIRERVFLEISSMLDCKYFDVCEMWLRNI